MHRHAGHLAERRAQGNEGDHMIPSEVVAAIKRILAQGKEAIVKKERGKWVVLENSKHLVYKEP
jgi:hypothetical protein